MLHILQKFERWMVYYKEKAGINDVAISKSLWLLEKIFWTYYMWENLTLLSGDELLATCQRKPPVDGFLVS